MSDVKVQIKLEATEERPKALTKALELLREMLDEYINEAEKQDGIDTWAAEWFTMKDNPPEELILLDFTFYIQNIEPNY